MNRPLADFGNTAETNPFRRRLLHEQQKPLRTLTLAAPTSRSSAYSYDRPLAAFPAASRLPTHEQQKPLRTLAPPPSRSSAYSCDRPLAAFPAASRLPTRSPSIAASSPLASSSRCNKSTEITGSSSMSTTSNNSISTMATKINTTNSKSCVDVRNNNNTLIYDSPKKVERKNKRTVMSPVLSPSPSLRKSSLKKLKAPETPQSCAELSSPRKNSKTMKSPKVDASKKSKASTPAHKVSDKKKSNKNIKASFDPPFFPTLKEDTREQDRLRIQELERKLAAIESEKRQELEAIHAETKRQKKDLAEQIRRNSDKAAEACRVHELQMEDNRRTVAALRAENDKIRTKNKELKDNCTNLRTNNERLEQTLRSNQDYHERLVDHHNRAMDSHAKLQKMCNDYQTKYNEMKAQVDNETGVARAERAHRGAYEKMYLKLVPRIRLLGDRVLARQIQGMMDRLNSKDNGWTKSNHSVHKVKILISSMDNESDSEPEFEEERPRISKSRAKKSKSKPKRRAM